MNHHRAVVSVVSSLFIGLPLLSGCSAEVEADEPTSEVTTGESEEALAPAIPLATCIATPACAAAVAAAIAGTGYALWQLRDAPAAVVRAAQRAANSWRASQACPPCPRPPADDSRYDSSHSHWPCPGAHTHHYTYRYNQNPTSCQCFLQKIEKNVTCH